MPSLFSGVHSIIYTIIVRITFYDFKVKITFVNLKSYPTMAGIYIF